MSGGPTVVDLRGFQIGTAGAMEANLLLAAPCALLGLIDPALPPLPSPVRGAVQWLCRNAYQAAAERPRRFVSLAPTADMLFAARLLGDPDLPAIGLAPPPLAGLDAALSRFWRSGLRVVAPGQLWDALPEGPAPAPSRTLTVLSATPDGMLEDGFAVAGATVRPLSELPLLAPGRVAIVVRERRSLALLRRYGGEAVLADATLLPALVDERAQVERELGRPVPEEEWLQWQVGIACPPPLFGEAVGAAARVFVTSPALAEAVARHGPVPTTVLPPSPALRLCAFAAGLQAEATLWALEWLGFRGVPARMNLVVPQPERPALQALAERLGLSRRVQFGACGLATRFLFLAMPGESAMAADLAAAAASGLPCLATASLRRATGVDGPTVPDQASPILLAEAIACAAPDSSAWRDALA